MIRIFALLAFLLLPSAALAEKPACFVGGPCNQLCLNSNVIPPAGGECSQRPEYSCYQRVGKCQMQAYGYCGCTATRELRSCINSVAAESVTKQ